MMNVIRTDGRPVRYSPRISAGTTCTGVRGKQAMAPHAIISYDDSRHDRDALMLGRVLRDAGAKLSLAYVRHAHQAQADREQLAESEAEDLLARGAPRL